MCLIIYKPAGVGIAEDLLAAAVSLNRDGWGVMGFPANGGLALHRQALTRLEDILTYLAPRIDDELVVHLRLRTRGAADARNVQPFEVVPGLFLMHNGTLSVQARLADRSDTWHLVGDILRPMFLRHPQLPMDAAFLRLLELGLTPANRVVLLHREQRRIEILNADQGSLLDGLWLSSTRWIDQRKLGLISPPQPQERSVPADKVMFG